MGEVRQQSKWDAAQRMHERYPKAKGKAEKTRLLDEFVEITGYDRVYAGALLRHGPPVRGGSIRRAGRPSAYRPRVAAALEVCAGAVGWICGKRLAAILPELVPTIEGEGALGLYGDERKALLSMKSATIDRKLRQARRVARPRGISATKPAGPLKSRIPVHTFTPWDEQAAGFVEIDPVAHCGESAAGEFPHALVATDIAIGRKECEPATNQGQIAVFAALRAIRHGPPFPLLRIDSDNGAEFVNAHLQATGWGRYRHGNRNRCSCVLWIRYVEEETMRRSPIARDALVNRLAPHLGTALVALSLTLAACGQDSAAPGAGRSATPTRATGTPPPTRATVVRAAPIDEEGLDRGARDYAREVGVSVGEARRRLLLMSANDGLGGRLEEREADTYAGMWWQHSPRFRLVVAFTRDGEETIRPYIEGHPYEGIVEVRTAGVTLRELLATQEETLRLLAKLDRRVDALIDVQRNRVEVPVTHRAWFVAAARRAGIKLPKHVVVVATPDSSGSSERAGRGRPVAVHPGPAPGIHLATRAPEEPVVRAGVSFEGVLRERDGCVRVASGSRGDDLVVWPHGFRAATERGKVVVLDPQGRVAARVGERVEMGGMPYRVGQVPRKGGWDLPAGCPGPYFEADEVSVR
jgi:hypothetical protein